MANPELRRDAPEHDWVQYLQGLLVSQLNGDAASGSVQLSAVDGYFGPITEASVSFFQTKSGISATGVVDDATWQVLEGTAVTPASSATPAPSTPIDLSVPFTLKTTWDNTTLDAVHNNILNFNVASQPNTQVQFGQRVGKLLGNGVPHLLDIELHQWNWFLEWSTKAALDYSKANGIQLGIDDHLGLGVRPIPWLQLSVDGNANLRWAPATATGTIKFDATFNVKINFNMLGGGHH